MNAPSTSEVSARRFARIAWCLFDFANSAFPTVALTAFGAPYFVGVLVGPKGADVGPFHLGPSGVWGLTISLSMLIVTFTSPLMGALADRSGRKRQLLFVYVLVCVAATGALAFVRPGQVVSASLLYIVANVAYEGAYVFYNAFLPELTTRDRIGRLSAWGWATGYAGGLLVLILCRPWMPSTYDADHTGRASFVFAIIAAWYLVFSLPALLALHDSPARGAPSDQSYARAALAQLRSTFHAVRAHRQVWIFLIAYFLYTDAITTVIEFTGVYTKEVLGFTPKDNITLFLVLNVVAAPGALVFGVLVDRIGPKRAVGASLVLWMLVVIGAVLSTTRQAFWPVAVLAAVVLGATQASSRAWMVHLSPKDRVGEFMGFLMFSGKASAVVGPSVYGLLADVAGNPRVKGQGHRIAMLAIGVFFIVGFWVLRYVRDSHADPSNLAGASDS